MNKLKIPARFSTKIFIIEDNLKIYNIGELDGIIKKMNKADY